MRSDFTFNLVTSSDDQFITVFVPGRDPLPAGSTHPSFKAIAALCMESMQGGTIDVDALCDLFDVAATVTRKFQRLSERVTVESGVICLDGDEVHGTLQEQILDFLDAGEDFDPLVNFYEKLMTNPLGDVRQGLYDWIQGQRENGALTITPDGDLIGYKSVQGAVPEWRKDQSFIYRPSRRGEGRVNGIDVSYAQFIEQVPGDVVEMPRSRVLNAPSMACGDGLHIGTYDYAQGFYGDTVLMVEFSPRDIVSLPDSCSTWKLRVCRYTVVGPCSEPLDVPVWGATTGDEIEDDEANTEFDPPTSYHGFEVGTKVDYWGREAVVVEEGPVREFFGRSYKDEYVPIEYVSGGYNGVYPDSLTRVEAPKIDIEFGPLAVGDRLRDDEGDYATVVQVCPNGAVDITYGDSPFGAELRIGADSIGEGEFLKRVHGKGGPTSQVARGNGRNPAQDTLGRYSAGRPGSARNGDTGRFA